MKKYKSVLAILVCICICIGFLGAMPVSAAQYDNSPLQNVYHKLNVDKKLTVGYIGGSVTKYKRDMSKIC